MLELPGFWILGLQLFATIIILGFLCELMDSTLGMGYGTTLTPVLLLFGFSPLAIVPSILLSELLTGLTAGVAHHKVGNVNFKKGSIHLKVATVLVACSVLGATAAVFIAINIPSFYLKLYIGIIVLLMGIIILLTINKKYNFSWKKITGLGLIAAFNKGMSGGGYGPVVTGGQILSGIKGNHAVGITSFAEGMTCVVGVIIYLVAPNSIDWSLAPSLIIGAMISVPFSAVIVKKLPTKILTLSIAAITIILGVVTIVNLFY